MNIILPENIVKISGGEHSTMREAVAISMELIQKELANNLPESRKQELLNSMSTLQLSYLQIGQIDNEGALEEVDTAIFG